MCLQAQQIALQSVAEWSCSKRLLRNGRIDAKMSLQRREHKTTNRMDTERKRRLLIEKCDKMSTLELTGDKIIKDYTCLHYFPKIVTSCDVTRMGGAGV
jgi:hypothetical protein